MWVFYFLLFNQVPEIDTSITIRPPTNVRAYDTPYDKGQSITVEWKLSPDDRMIDGYSIWRAEKGRMDFKEVGLTPPGVTKFVDEDTALVNGREYVYKVAALLNEDYVFSMPSLSVAPMPQWFDPRRINILVAMILFFSYVIYFINRAKKGEEIYLRRISGLAKIDEAVGRATEMGKPVLFIPSTTTIADVATIAAINILPGIAKKAAEYDIPIIVPNRDPVVYTVTREIVKEAYTDVGRPDAFNPDSVFYITGSQFGYTSAVNGIMVRERPAANFFMGRFYAEALLLAEVGAQTGAIQIAGTDAIAQLPFFITSCDYTIIGEELYAASAYISREPTLVGTIKGQDYGKATMMVMLAVGTLLSLIGLSKFVLSILATY